MKGTELKDQSHGEIIVQQTAVSQNGMFLNFKQLITSTHSVFLMFWYISVRSHKQPMAVPLNSF